VALRPSRRRGAGEGGAGHRHRATDAGPEKTPRAAIRALPRRGARRAPGTPARVDEGAAANGDAVGKVLKSDAKIH